MRSLALLVGIIAGVIFGVARIATSGALPPDALIVIGLGLGLTIGLAVRQRSGGRPPVDGTGGADDDIRKRGLIGRATVIAARPTGHVEGDRREFDLHLEVQLPRRRRFETDVRTLVPDSWADRIRPGGLIAVAADPAQPGHVVPAFDVDELVSIAGLGPFAGGRGGPRPLEGVDPDRRGPDDGR